MTRAVIEIEKLQKGLSKNIAEASALKSMNEDILKEYKKMRVIFDNKQQLIKFKKYIIDLEEYGFDVEVKGLTMTVDSNGKGDLNKYGSNILKTFITLE